MKGLSLSVFDVARLRLPSAFFWKFAVLKLGFSLSVACNIACYATYVVQYKGFGLGSLTVFSFFFFGFAWLFEAPTGRLADRYGRKTSFVLACAMLVVGRMCFVFTNKMSLMLASEVVNAFGAALASGAFQAWCVDELGSTDAVRYMAYEASVNQIGLLAGSLLGAYFYVIRPEYPWLFGAGSAFVTMLLAIVFMRNVKYNRGNSSAGDEEINKLSSWRFLKQCKIMQLLMIASVVHFFAIQSASLYWQIFFGKFFIDQKKFGWLAAAAFLMSAVGSVMIRRFSLMIDNHYYLLIITHCVTALSLIMLGVYVNIAYSLVAFALLYIGRGLFDPLPKMLIVESLQERNNDRAFLFSVQVMSFHLGRLMGNIFAGTAIIYYSIEFTWVISGIVLFIFMMVLIMKIKMVKA